MTTPIEGRKAVLMSTQRERHITTRPFSVSAAASAPLHHADPLTTLKRDHLRASLLSAVDLLYQRRANLIGDSTIDDYVALHWLEWNGGALRLTLTGQNICDQLKIENRESQAL